MRNIQKQKFVSGLIIFTWLEWLEPGCARTVSVCHITQRPISNLYCIKKKSMDMTTNNKQEESLKRAYGYFVWLLVADCNKRKLKQNAFRVSVEVDQHYSLITIVSFSTEC